MGEVVDINKNKPHLSGTVRCLSCKYEWQGVCLIGIVSGIECPRCGLECGAMRNLCYPADCGILECNCGNSHFIIEETHKIVCAYCGEIHGTASLD